MPIMANSMLASIRNAFKLMVDSARFDRVLEKVNILSAETGKVRAEMTICTEHTNYLGALHGGMTATLVDKISTLALTTTLLSPPFDQQSSSIASVSVELSVCYMNAVSIGQTIVIEANTLKCGKSLAFLDVNIFEKNTNKLVATGKHTKYILNKSSL